MTEPDVASAAADPTITAHALVVPRTARYYTLGPTHGFPRELWFVCHGYGQLAERFLRQFAPLDDGTRLIVAPEGLSRFYLDPLAQRRNDPSPRVGATWMTREDRDAEIADYVAYLERLAAEIRHPLAGAAPRIVVLGFSQGTATVSRWLAASDLRVDQLVLWGGAIARRGHHPRRRRPGRVRHRRGRGGGGGTTVGRRCRIHAAAIRWRALDRPRGAPAPRRGLCRPLSGQS